MPINIKNLRGKNIAPSQKFIEYFKITIGEHNYRYLIGYIHKLIWKTLNYHKKGDKNDIFIFTSGRSGGTWLTEMICTTKGMRYSQEPLSLELINHHRTKDLSKLRDGYNFIDDNKDLRPLKNYFVDIINGKIDIKNPWKVNKPYFQISTDRTVFKICKALPLIEWFYDNFQAHFIYFFRHPIASALSMEKNNFRYEIGDYLNNPNYLKNHLNYDLYKLAKKIDSEGYPILKYVLRWILENLVPFKFFLSKKRKNCFFLSYEELVTKPLDCINYLANNCALDKNKMIKYLGIPSATTLKKFITDIYGPNSPLINKWKEKVCNKTVKDCYDLINDFGILLYSENSLFPREDFSIT